MSAIASNNVIDSAENESSHRLFYFCVKGCRSNSLRIICQKNNTLAGVLTVDY